MDIVSKADIVLVAEESTTSDCTREILESLPPLGKFQRVVVARTKADLKVELPEEPCSARVGGVIVVEVSALTGYGVRQLEQALVEEVGLEQVGSDSTMAVTNRRHWDALRKGIGSLDSALTSLKAGATNEFVAFDVRECVASLSGITGEVTTEDVLNHIFARFCVGK